MNGISFLLVIGRPLWFKFEWAKSHVRLVVGPFSFWIIFSDLEVFFAYVRQLKEQYDQ